MAALEEKQEEKPNYIPGGAPSNIPQNQTAASNDTARTEVTTAAKPGFIDKAKNKLKSAWNTVKTTASDLAKQQDANAAAATAGHTTGGGTIDTNAEVLKDHQTLKYHLLNEDYGKVYIKYYAEGEWMLLYDFTEFEWEVGDCLLTPESNSTPIAIESLDTITLNDGTIRQVAKYNHGELIYGMGYAGEPFFECLTNMKVENDEQRSPVNFYCYDQLLWGKELPKKQELRFFPANAVYATNRHYNARYDENHNPIENAGEFTYNVWTGNDTIVDGRESVVLWHNKAGYTQRYGVIYEDHTGLVYLNYLQGDKSDWLFLYDFTPRIWKAGDMMHVGYDEGYVMYEKVYEVSTIGLQDGTTAPLIELTFNGIIYGIGYYDEPFLSPIQTTTLCSAFTRPISFYRNGVLLWGKGEEEKPGNSVVAPMVNKALTPYYDLQGRPVVNPTRGIYIKDGKKVIIGQ